jgi:hypothetical protein
MNEENEKPVKTREELAAIAYLDKLRRGVGETMPTELPLACVVKVVAYKEIPKANEKYALVTVRGPIGITWKMCVNRHYLKKGMNALFVSKGAAMPEEERFRNPEAAKVKLRVFKFGPGIKERRLLPIVSRNIYLFNCGLLYPLDDFPELQGVRAGMVCAVKLRIDRLKELHERVAAPKPKQKKKPAPAPKAESDADDSVLAKVRRYYIRVWRAR